MIKFDLLTSQQQWFGIGVQLSNESFTTHFSVQWWIGVCWPGFGGRMPHYNAICDVAMSESQFATAVTDTLLKMKQEGENEDFNCTKYNWMMDTSSE